MALFDPAAATAAYLASVPPAVNQQATAYTQLGHWCLLGGALVTLLACVLIARTRVLERISAGLQRRRPRPLLISFLVAVSFFVLDTIIELPWTWFSDWKRNTDFGLTHQPVAGWLTELVINSAISALALGLFFVALYALIRRAPKWWWILAGGLAAVFIVIVLLLSPIFIDPIFNTYRPAPPGPVREAVTALARENGIPPDRIFVFNGSKQSDRFTANVAGLFGTARVAMSDTMFRGGADIAGVRAVVGHEMGHYAHRHTLWLVGITSLEAVGFFFLIAKLFPLAARAMGVSAQVGDPVGLPVVMAILTLLALAATPILSTTTRVFEADADAYSFAHAHEPDGFAREMMKTVSYRAASPSAIEEFVFYDHPSIQHRVRAAMDWKAAHPAPAR